MADYTINRMELLRALKIAACGLAPKRTVVPVFDMFFLADDRVFSYNDVVGVVVELEEATGLEALLPGDALLKLLPWYSVSTVKISAGAADAKEQELKVRCGRSSAKLQTMSIHSWPWKGPPENDCKATFNIPLNDSVIRGMRSLMATMSYTDTVPSYNGMLLDSVDGGSSFLCTTNRKAISTFRIPVKTPSGPPLYLPPVFCEHLVSIWDQTKEESGGFGGISVRPDHVVAWFGETSEVCLFSRLLYAPDADEPKTLLDRVREFVGDRPLSLKKIPDEFRNVVDRFVALSCDELELRKDAGGVTATAVGGGGAVGMKERFSWGEDIDQPLRIDVPLFRRVTGQTDLIDVRSGDDRFIVVADEDNNLQHLLACGRGERE